MAGESTDTCTKCGAPVQAGDVFCQQCGATVGSPAEAGVPAGPWPSAGGPGFVTYGATWPDGTPAIDPYVPLRGRAAWARGLLIAYLVVVALSIMANLYRASVIDSYLDDRSTGIDEFERSDDLSVAVGVLALLTIVPTVVLFLRWMSRAYRNLPALGARDLRFTPGWAVGAWFVPFLNLVRPKALMDDTWKASDPALPPGPTNAWRIRPVAGIVHWWWAVSMAWVVMSFFSQVREIGDVDESIAGELDRLDRLENLASSSRVGALVSILTLVAGILLVVIIGRLTARQAQRSTTAAAPPAGGGQWSPEGVAPGVQPRTDQPDFRPPGSI